MRVRRAIPDPHTHRRRAAIGALHHAHGAGRGRAAIVTIKPTGAVVKAQDVIVEFDPSESFSLQQARSEFLEVQEEIKKTNLDAAIQSARDAVALLQARFAVGAPS